MNEENKVLLMTIVILLLACLSYYPNLICKIDPCKEDCIITTREFTSNSEKICKTTCEGTVCSLVLYSGVRFSKEGIRVDLSKIPEDSVIEKANISIIKYSKENWNWNWYWHCNEWSRNTFEYGFGNAENYGTWLVRKGCLSHWKERLNKFEKNKPSLNITYTYIEKKEK